MQLDEQDGSRIKRVLDNYLLMRDSSFCVCIFALQILEINVSLISKEDYDDEYVFTVN